METTAEILREVFSQYAKMPDKKKHKDAKGSVARLIQRYSDMLSAAVADVGDELIPAMENFLQDEYWEKSNFPIHGFRSQYRRFLPSAPKPTEAETASKPKSGKPAYQPRETHQPDSHRIDEFRAGTGAEAVRRKREALDMLHTAKSPLAASLIAEIGFKLTPEMYPAVESWHDRAVQEYKRVMKREPVVITEAVA